MTTFRMLIALALASLALSACIEYDFDEPPVAEVGVELDANATIADLKEYFVPGEFTEITDDILVDAVIVADDESGNYFKTLVLQDETGGILFLLNRTDLYTRYAAGREVYVNAQGLYISDFNGTLQIGGAPTLDNNGNERLGQLDNALIDEALVLGRDVGVPSPREVGINDLGPADISTLVTLCDVQFAPSDTSGTLANAAERQSLNRIVEDCDFNTLIVRTSGFSDLARIEVPNGGGCITGVYGVFGNDRQLFIRDTNDLRLTGNRCDGSSGSGGGGGGPVDANLTIEEIRGLWNGNQTNLPTDRAITGVVISDNNSGTTTGRNLILQQDGYGITLRFADFHNFALGDRILVNVSGVELSEFNGTLQLNNVPLSNARLVSANQSVTPLDLTIAQILADFERYEGSLVRIRGGRLTADDGDWAFTTTINDGTGSLAIFTPPGADFAGEAVPADTVDVTGYLNEFNAPQIILRDLSDVVVSGGSGGGTGGGGGGGGTGSAVDELSEDFQGQSDREAVAITGWLNFTAVDEGRTWQAREFDGNLYAQATAFNDDAARMDTWLVTPALDFDEAATISFETATSFNVHQGLEVLVSTDYVGTGDPANATWSSLDAPIANGSSGDNVWVQSGEISLAPYNGTGYVAFHYTGNGASNTSTFRVDNVVVTPQ